MPTQKRRTALSLPPEVEAAVTDLAEATGKPVATVIVELLAEMAPQLRDLAKIARHLKNGKTSAAKRALRHMVGDAMAEVAMATQREIPLKGGK